MAENFNKIGAKLVLDGESDYRAALRNITSEQKTLNSQMKLLKEEFATNANSMAALKEKGQVLASSYDSQKEKIKVLETALANYKETQEKAGSKVVDLRDKLATAESVMKKMESTSTSTAEEIDTQKKVVADLEKELKVAEGTYNSSTKQINNYQGKIYDANAELLKLDKEISANDKYLKEAENSTDNTAKSIDEFGEEIKTAKKETSTFGEVLKANLVSEAIITGVKKIASEVKKLTSYSLGVGSNFEESMSLVAATMGMTAQEVRDGSEDFLLLSSTAKECGAATKYTASQSAEALNYLALAGYDAAKASEALPKVLDLAAAGGLELAYASDLVTDSMASLGMETKDLDNYMDQMAKTAQKSNTNVAQLGEATLVVAGTAKNADVELKTMNAELGVLANRGIKGAEGGTHLRNIILSLTAPTDAAAKAMKDLGLRVNNTDGSIRNMNDIMTDLNSILSTMSASERINVLNTIFNKTDLTAANALLSGTNGEFANLYKELENCDNACSNMAETMNDNLKGKLTILGSAAEAVGITFYEKFQGPLKNATDSGITALEKLNTELKSGKLGQSVDGLAESFEGFAEKCINLAMNALPLVVDGFSFIINNADILIAGLVGISAAMLTQKAVDIITKANAAWNIYKVATEGATIKQWLLNAAQAASPVGWIGIAVGAVVSGLVLWASNAEEAANSTQKLTNEADVLIASSTALNEEMLNSKTQRKANVESIKDEYTAIQDLSDRLYALNDKENKTNAEKKIMIALVEQLNGAIPKLNLNIDEETGLLNKQKTEVDSLIASKKEYYLQQAAEKDLVEIAEELYEAQKKLNELIEKKIELEKEYWNTIPDSGDAMALSDRIKEIDAQIKTTEETVASCGEEFEKVSTVVEEATESINEDVTETTEITVKYGDKTKQVSEATATEFEEIKTKYQELKEKATESIESQIGLFEKYNTTCELSITQMIDNMQKNNEAMKNWADNLQTASKRGVEEGLLQELADAGIASAGYLQKITGATDEEIEKMNKAWRERTQWAEYAGTAAAETRIKVEDEFNKLTSDIEEDVIPKMKQIGGDTADGFGEGLRSRWESVKGITKIGLNDLITQSKGVLQIHSPSRVFKEIGEYTGEGFEIGAENSLKSAQNKIKKIMSDTAYDAEILNGLQVYNDTVQSIQYNPTTNFENKNIYSGMLEEIATLLKGIAMKDSNTYLDGEKVSELIAPKIDSILGIGY